MCLTSLSYRFPDPVYITSGQQQHAPLTMHHLGQPAGALPRFDHFFSDGWKQQHTPSGRTRVFGPPAQVTGMHSPAVIRRAAAAQEDRRAACKRAAVAKVHTHRSVSLPRRKLVQQMSAVVGAHLDSAASEERQRLKVAFEASLPPMSDPRGIALR